MYTYIEYIYQRPPVSSSRRKQQSRSSVTYTYIDVPRAGDILGSAEHERDSRLLVRMTTAINRRRAKIDAEPYTRVMLSCAHIITAAETRRFDLLEVAKALLRKV